MPAKRKKETPGVTRLKNGRFLVDVQWSDRGKPKRRRRTVDTLAEAERAREELRGAPVALTGRALRVSDYAERWVASEAVNWRPSTQTWMADCLGHAIAALGDYRLAELRVSDIKEWRTAISAEGYAKSSVNNYLRALRWMLSGALDEGLIAENPAKRVKGLTVGKTKGRRGRSLNADQFADMTNALRRRAGEELAWTDEAGTKHSRLLSADVARLLQALAWSGSRIGEMLELRWDDWSNGQLKIERAVWRRCVGPTKTDDPREVFVVEPLARVLREQRQWLMKTQHEGLASGLVFPASPRHAKAGAKRRQSDTVAWWRSSTTVQQPLLAICRVEGLPELSAHCFRRTLEDISRAAGVDGVVRRAQSGWKSTEAQDIYANVSKEDRARAGAAVVSLVERSGRNKTPREDTPAEETKTPREPVGQRGVIASAF